jgi:hypothetical protein
VKWRPNTAVSAAPKILRLPWHRSAGNIMHTPQAALFRVPLTLQRISIPARIVREETDRGRGLAAAPQMTF